MIKNLVITFLLTFLFIAFANAKPKDGVQPPLNSSVQAAQVQAEAVQKSANTQAEATVQAAKTQAQATIDAANDQKWGAIFAGLAAFLAGCLGFAGLWYQAQSSAKSAQTIKDKELGHEKFMHDQISDREYVAYLSICHTEAWNRKAKYENISTEIRDYISRSNLPSSNSIQQTEIKLFIVFDNDRKHFGRLPKEAFDIATESTKISSEYNYQRAVISNAIKITETIVHDARSNLQNVDQLIYNHHADYAKSLLPQAATLLDEYAKKMAQLPPIIEQELDKTKKIMIARENSIASTQNK